MAKLANSSSPQKGKTQMTMEAVITTEAIDFHNKIIKLILEEQLAFVNSNNQ